MATVLTILYFFLLLRDDITFALAFFFCFLRNTTIKIFSMAINIFLLQKLWTIFRNVLGNNLLEYINTYISLVDPLSLHVRLAELTSEDDLWIKWKQIEYLSRCAIFLCEKNPFLCTFIYQIILLRLETRIAAKFRKIFVFSAKFLIQPN
jgi:hypothetical protein